MGKIRSFLVLLVLVALVCTFMISCSGSGAPTVSSSDSSSQSNDQLERILADGKITVAMILANAPWGYKDPATGKISGIAVDMIEHFADEFGVEVEYLPLEFSAMIPSITSGKADIIALNLSRTISRSAKVMFTEPVGAAPGVAVVRKGEFSSFDDVNKSGVVLTTAAGSIHEEMGQKVFPNAEMKAVPQNADASAALKAGRADVFCTGQFVAQALVDKNPDEFEILPGYTFMDSFAFAVPLSKDSFTFWEVMNNYIRLIKIDGTFNNIWKEAFGVNWVPDVTEEGL